MLICGVKASHDGAVAFIDSDRMELLASVETEKCGNGARRGPITSMRMLVGMMGLVGFVPKDVDRWVLDGWGDDTRDLAPEVVVGDVTLPTAPYVQMMDGTPPLHPYSFSRCDTAYESYRHVEGHLASAYATRPDDDPTAVLVWDGAMYPQLYVIDKDVEFLGSPFRVRSCVFEQFGGYLSPFNTAPVTGDGGDNAGKLMAFAGLGQPNDELVAAIVDAWPLVETLPPAQPGGLFELIRPTAVKLGVGGPSIFASFQTAVGLLLITHLQRERHALPDRLCIAGGAGLNIKWNSMIRNSGLFESVWVPPFPNDAGSAIGAAYASLMSRGERRRLSWDVYTGPDVVPSITPGDWVAVDCTVEELGGLLARDGGPVTVIDGRAELGPRALGHRSIMAAPTKPWMKKLLNDIKGREDYRPVAPMCLEERAQEIFDPGVPDPYMLFDHKVRQEWVDRIPAVLHLDGTARLQTVAPGSLPYDIIKAYERHTGVPVLCNTSANHRGKGFFPDVESAMRWGMTPYVWSNNTLYRRVRDNGTMRRRSDHA